MGAGGEVMGKGEGERRKIEVGLGEWFGESVWGGEGKGGWVSMSVEFLEFFSSSLSICMELKSIMLSFGDRINGG